MEKTTSTSRPLGLLVIFALFTFLNALYAQTIVHQATFESGTEGWTLVSNSYRDFSATWAAENNYSIRIRSGSGQMRSPGLSLAAYDKVDISFYMTNRGYDTGETFDIEYRPDNATAWQIIGTYVAGSVAGKTADFQSGYPYIDYAKTSTIFKADHTFPSAATAQFRFSSNSSSTNDRVHIDYVTITGTTYNTSITEGPGGVNNNLELWLMADKADGTGSYADNVAITTWQDVAKGNDANSITTNQAPTFKDNSTDNINFNPVIEFSNNNNLSTSDMSYLTNRDEMQGTAGFYSDDIYMVVIPDQPINNTMIPLDTFTSNDPTGDTFTEDVTGFGYGAYTQRFNAEYFAYCIGTTNGVGNGYGKGDLTNSVDLNQIGIINARHNDIASPSSENIYFNNIEIGDSESDAPDFAGIDDRRYWLGRSQYWNGSFGGRISEVITYSATNTDGSTADNRNRILSYLAIKYGITLGVNGVSQDYVDANGTLIWEQASTSALFNHDIAGIGRSDAAGLMQKQSKSVNANTMITMGIANIEATNNQNTNTIPVDESYLVWGNDATSLNAVSPIIVDMSQGVAGLSTIVEFTSVERTWKVVETGGDVPTVEVSVPEISLSATITPPGEYLMFISDSPNFSPSSEYRVMTLNGANLETTYDFNGTKFITFGFAPRRVYVRSVEFDGVVDYMDSDDKLDLTGPFSVSAWVKKDAGAVNRDIISKRNAGPYTEGYTLRLDASGVPQMIWKDEFGTNQVISGSVAIPESEWHQIAVTYDGTNAVLYVDGVQDGPPVPLAPPVENTQHFLIAAANYLSPTAHWDGSIDEVRVWNTALSTDQVRFIMNQELIEHSDNTVTGTIIPQSISKNEVSVIDWSELSAYYPMTTYTFTNIQDESGNGNTSAIKNLDTVDFQTAPLPYQTDADGDWDTTNTWLNSNVMQIPGATSIVDNSVTIDWNITRVDHDLTASTNTTVLGLFLDTNSEILVDNNNKLEITHYLDLNGFIDLIDESQLVQTAGSDLDRFSPGYIEIDQQGTADTYTYNYWSSPTGNLSWNQNNVDTNINRMLRDGSDVNNPIYVNWLGGYNGAAGTPISLSDFWLFKYDNHPIGDYSSWQYLGQWGTLSVGQGFTMKGPGTGGVTDLQNYTFTGKPNNDQTGYEIELYVNGGNNYLVGNPFASALDGDDFINENPHLNGSIYFWEHWGGGSHVLGEYQGGYATYNLSGGNPAMSHPDVSSAGSGTKTPGRYVPVSQGFFVAADTDGYIELNNSQRNFVRESAASVFVFADNGDYIPAAPSTTTSYSEPDDSQLDGPDLRTKLRIGFDSPMKFHRQLLLTFDDNTTLDYDHGYDAKLFDDQLEDLSWLIADEAYVIQGVPSLNNDDKVVLPLTVRIEEAGEIIIGIDLTENMTEKLVPYLHDSETDIYTDLREKKYATTIAAGTNATRFSLVLRKTPFVNGDSVIAGKQTVTLIDALHQKSNEVVQVYFKTVQDQTINKVVVYNTIGQLVAQYTYNGLNSQVEFPSTNLAGGAYILQISTSQGVHTAKVLIDK